MAELKKALESLGVTGTITTRSISKDRLEVRVDGIYFGIWDVSRRTFVD